MHRDTQKKTYKYLIFYIFDDEKKLNDWLFNLILLTHWNKLSEYKFSHFLVIKNLGGKAFLNTRMGRSTFIVVFKLRMPFPETLNSCKSRMIYLVQSVFSCEFIILEWYTGYQLLQIWSWGKETVQVLENLWQNFIFSVLLNRPPLSYRSAPITPCVTSKITELHPASYIAHFNFMHFI